LLNIISNAQQQDLIGDAFEDEDSLFLRPFIRALIPIAKSEGDFPDSVAAAQDAVEALTSHFGFTLVPNANAPDAG